MIINRRLFGEMPDKKQVYCWTIIGEDNITVEVLNYGATIHKLAVPDKNNQLIDVVLGYDTLFDYMHSDGYLGATVGRFANRIRNASFELYGKNVNLTANFGCDHVHGGVKGFDKVLWEAEQVNNGVRFSYLSVDGEEGYPGNLNVSVTVTIEHKELKLVYHATSDQDTVLNLTNHMYFNLDGEGQILNHFLQIDSEYFLEVDDRGFPTGKIKSIKGTPFDFTVSKRIGDTTHNQDYNHCYLLSEDSTIRACSEKTGIEMVIRTDQPGVHFYTAGKLSSRVGKKGIIYGPKTGFCLETQHYPDSVHHPEWPSCALHAGEVFESITSFSFDVL